MFAAAYTGTGWSEKVSDTTGSVLYSTSVIGMIKKKKIITPAVAEKADRTAL